MCWFLFKEQVTRTFSMLEQTSLSTCSSVTSACVMLAWVLLESSRGLLTLPVLLLVVKYCKSIFVAFKTFVEVSDDALELFLWLAWSPI